MVEPNAYVPEPDLAVSDDTPVSAAFGDVYFSRGGGMAETEHVFLKGNGLPERWQGRKSFTIGELGFGTGLNFLVSLKRFRETADAGAVLHYIAIEKYPFARKTLRAVLALQPELARGAAELLAAYPLRLPGIHRIHLPRAVLTLCIGDVGAMLEELSQAHLGERSALREPRAAGVSDSVGDKVPFNYMCIDAWYLDGFSPAKNAAMWSEDILARIGGLSDEGTTFATFTSAGDVRRGLQAAGFAVEKVAGFGHKREMSRGIMEGGSLPPTPCGLTPAAARVGVASVGQNDLPKNVIIIGAGIAGATLAHALAVRGLAVTVLDCGALAGGASGNAAGVLFPQLTKQWTPSAAWSFTAYGFMLRQLQHWKDTGLAFASESPGMLRLPRHEEEAAQLQALGDTLGLDASIVHWVTRDAASAQAGIPLATGAAFFPGGTWISPVELCRALLAHESIMLREHAAAKNLARDGDGWRVTLADGEVMTAWHVCVTAAHESALLLGDYGIRLNAVGGQVSEISARDVAVRLRSILCAKGYVVPHSERYLIGATYHREEMDAVTDERHGENIAELNALLPGWFHGQAIGGRSSQRATTPDRLPYVGAVDDGLYVSTGHGSRGLLSAPLAAEMIAASLCGEMPPVTQQLAHLLRPLRFTKA